jgi:hypothetical protein
MRYGMILKGAGAKEMIFAETYALYKTVKSFSYMRSIGRRDEQNILKFDLAVFCLKHKGLKLNSCQVRCVLSSRFLTHLVLFLQLSFSFIYCLLFMVLLETVD